jgi:hypothetical protein
MLFVGGLLGLLLGALTLLAVRVIAPGIFPKQGGIFPGFYIGSLPTGRDGAFSRADYLRVAARSLLGAAACFLASLAGAWLTSKSSGMATEQLALGVTAFFGLLGFLSSAAACTNAWKAVFWRPQRLASEWSAGDDD